MLTMNMSTTTKSKVNNMVSIVMLVIAALYGLSTILVLYSGFLTFPPILETTDDIKYALGFFYVPLVTVVVALGALALKMRAGSKRLSQRFAQLGLFLSGGLIAWWLTFESGFLPTIFLPAVFLVVVLNDRKENKQLAT
jgi:hypothetical protein